MEYRLRIPLHAYLCPLSLPSSKQAFQVAHGIVFQYHLLRLPPLSPSHTIRSGATATCVCQTRIPFSISMLLSRPTPACWSDRFLSELFLPCLFCGMKARSCGETFADGPKTFSDRDLTWCFVTQPPRVQPSFGFLHTLQFLLPNLRAGCARQRWSVLPTRPSPFLNSLSCSWYGCSPGVSTLWPVEQIWANIHFSKCTFMGTQPHPVIYVLSVTASVLRQQSWVVLQRISGPQT